MRAKAGSRPTPRKITRARLTETFSSAMVYAAHAHRKQLRKGTTIPYIGHLMAVAAIVLEAGGTETEAVAALLHDVVEDQPLSPGGGRARLDDVRNKFGPKVADIVEALSDWISEHDDERKDDVPYLERKRRYHDHLRRETNRSVFLISAADKLHNALAMESDFDHLGQELWLRFNGTRDEILRNYETLIDIYRQAIGRDNRLERIVTPLKEAVRRLKERSATIPSSATKKKPA